MKTTKSLLATFGFCFVSITFFGQTQVCMMGSLPSVQFKVNCSTLSKDNMKILDAAALIIKNNPGCKVKIIGYGASDKNAQQLSWDHVNNVKTYLTEHTGISETRIIFNYGQEGDKASVDLVATTEDGPGAVPAPHPNLRKNINFKCN